jgi:hypothetical protein
MNAKLLYQDRYHAAEGMNPGIHTLANVNSER